MKKETIDLRCDSLAHGLLKVPNASVDYVFTRPDDQEGSWGFVFRECWRALREGGVMHVVCFPSDVPLIHEKLRDKVVGDPWGMLGEVVLWTPPRPRTASGPYVALETLTALVLCKGTPPVPKRPCPGVLDFRKGTSPRADSSRALGVLAAKKLFRYFSQPGDTVLDPYGRAGDTAIACEHTRRNAVVITQSRLGYDLALERLQAERQQLKLPLAA